MDRKTAKDFDPDVLILFDDYGLPGAAGGGEGQAAGHPRRAREPRTQPAHRGHCAPAGAGQLRRGGGIAHILATRLPDLGAAVPFYGNPPAPEEAAKVKAPLLVHFAESDQRINAAWPAYEAALKAAGVSYAAHTYPGTQHGFNNDTTPRYDEAAAKLAWSRTLEFFNKHLRG